MLSKFKNIPPKVYLSFALLLMCIIAFIWADKTLYYMFGRSMFSYRTRPYNMVCSLDLEPGEYWSFYFDENHKTRYKLSTRTIGDVNGHWQAVGYRPIRVKISNEDSIMIAENAVSYGFNMEDIIIQLVDTCQNNFFIRPLIAENKYYNILLTEQELREFKKLHWIKLNDSKCLWALTLWLPLLIGCFVLVLISIWTITNWYEEVAEPKYYSL